jgi:hypothetical protein
MDASIALSRGNMARDTPSIETREPPATSLRSRSSCKGGDDRMPAKSKAQQKAAGAALSAKRKETPKSALKGASREMESSMTEKELEDLAATKRKPLPERK